jgi:site-specific DNA recombinase
MNLVEPLRPKDLAGGLRVIIPARISTPGQDPASNASQHEDTERFLARVYANRVEVRRLADQASGWLVDRPCMVELAELVASGAWDLVLVSEVRELYRNPRLIWQVVQDCVDNDTRFISISDNIDTADENWEFMVHAACFKHGMAVPDARRRVRRMATHTFKGGGMVLKVRFGYRKLTREEAASGEFGPVGLRLAKVTAATPYLHGMRLRVLAGVSYPVISDWLNDEGVDPGPYVTGRKWTGALVRDLLRDPILSGQRQFRKEVSRLVFGKGKNKPRANPKPPEKQDCPELAHFTPAEHAELLAVMDRRKVEAARHQRSGRDSPLYNVPRARSLWPGRHARCAACGGLMYRYGETLKCQNALGKGPRTCWNHVLVRIPEVRARVLPLVLEFLDRHGPLRNVIAEAAWAEAQRLRGRQNRSAAVMDRRIDQLEKRAARLAKAIGDGVELDAVVTEAKEVQGRLAAAREEQVRLAAEGDRAGVYRSAGEIEADLANALAWLAAVSRDFAGILRGLIPSFEVVPVQALDTPAVRPRARLTMSAAAWAKPGEPVPDGVTSTIDLFDPPEHIRHAPRCWEAKQASPEASLQDLADALGINRMTVKRALDYRRRMDEAGVSDPYKELTACPSAASRWRYRTRPGAEPVGPEAG